MTTANETIRMPVRTGYVEGDWAGARMIFRVHVQEGGLGYCLRTAHGTTEFGSMVEAHAALDRFLEG